MIPKVRLLAAGLAVGLIFLGTSGQQAFAEIGTATYTFNISNGGDGAPSTGDFGNAVIDVTSTTSATITYTATAPNQFVGVGFNFDGTQTDTATPGVITDVTNLPTGWSSAQGNMDGFGNFTYRFEGSGASTAVSSLTLDITGTNLELSEFQVFSTVPPGTTPSIVGAHIYNPTLTGGDGSGTFFAGSGSTPPPAVPEPSTLAIAGLGALGFVGFGLRRRLKK